MALAKCKECGKDISTEATVCPNCGKKAPTRSGFQPTRTAGCLIAFLLLAGIGSLVESSHPTPTPIAQDAGSGGTSLPASKPLTPESRKALILATADKSCKPSGSRVASLIKSHPNWDNDVILVVGCHRFRVGFTETQLRAALGAPDQINRTVIGSNESDQWVYGDTYVYVENGVVTSFQTSN